MERLLKNIWELDRTIWYAINVQGQNSFFDALAPILRNPITWSPLYLFLLIFMLYRFGKKGIYWCLAFLITFGIGDYTSASIIKPMAQRLRPCNDVSLQKVIHLLVDCGSGYSFPSSHATNHFALAFFMIISLGKLFTWIRIPLILWAFSIAYAQVYVGVHYPFDVLFGALLGSSIGIFVGFIFDKKIQLKA